MTTNRSGGDAQIEAPRLLIVNDYIRYSHLDDSYYGVIPVVNDLVVNQEFKVVGARSPSRHVLRHHD